MKQDALVGEGDGRWDFEFVDLFVTFGIVGMMLFDPGAVGVVCELGERGELVGFEEVGEFELFLGGRVDEVMHRGRLTVGAAPVGVAFQREHVGVAVGAVIARSGFEFVGGDAVFERFVGVLDEGIGHLLVGREVTLRFHVLTDAAICADLLIKKPIHPLIVRLYAGHFDGDAVFLRRLRAGCELDVGGDDFDGEWLRCFRRVRRFWRRRYGLLFDWRRCWRVRGGLSGSGWAAAGDECGAEGEGEN